MTTGYWVNQDGLPLQFGVSKAQTSQGGDYLVYGETREIEQLIPLVPMAMGVGGVQTPAPPTSFSGTSTPIAAGIQQLTNIVPLQITPVTTVSGGVLTFSTSQLFFEQVEVDTIVGATGGTSISVGLVASQPYVPAQSQTTPFVQVTPNAGVQILNACPIARYTTTGQKTLYTQAGTTGLAMEASTGLAAGGGTWMGSVPLVTNTMYNTSGALILPSKAYISTIATGTFTSGLIKLRLRYTLYGNISQ